MVSFIGGALAGAAAMYLMDPEMGARRRRMIAEQTGDCMEGTKDILHSGWDKVAGYAGDVGQTVAEKAQQYRSQLSDVVQDNAADWRGHAHDVGASLADRAGGWLNRGSNLLRRYSHQAQDYVPTASQISDNLSDYGKSLWKQARGMGTDMKDRARSRARSYLGERSPVVPVAITAIGCCAVGAGIMYMIDPRLGRARRAWLMDKSRSVVNRTGKSFYRSGRHMANRAKGVVAETRGAGEQLVERVRNAISGVVNDPRVVQVMCDANGTITLIGRLAAEQCDRVLHLVEGVPGVNLVVNRLERLTGQSSDASSPRNAGV